MSFLEEHWVTVISILIELGLLKYLFNFLKAYRARESARNQAIRSLLRTEIINICNKAEEKKYLPIYNLENINEMYKAYKELGGNGAITDLYIQVKGYPHSPQNDNKLSH